MRPDRGLIVNILQTMYGTEGIQYRTVLEMSLTAWSLVAVETGPECLPRSIPSYSGTLVPVVHWLGTQGLESQTSVSG